MAFGAPRSASKAHTAQPWQLGSTATLMLQVQRARLQLSRQALQRREAPAAAAPLRDSNSRPREPRAASAAKPRALGFMPLPKRARRSGSSGPRQPRADALGPSPAPAQQGPGSAGAGRNELAPLAGPGAPGTCAAEASQLEPDEARRARPHGRTPPSVGFATPAGAHLRAPGLASGGTGVGLQSRPHRSTSGVSTDAHWRTAQPAGRRAAPRRDNAAGPARPGLQLRLHLSNGWRRAGGRAARQPGDPDPDDWLQPRAGAQAPAAGLEGGPAAPGAALGGALGRAPTLGAAGRRAGGPAPMRVEVPAGRPAPVQPALQVERGPWRKKRSRAAAACAAPGQGAGGAEERANSRSRVVSGTGARSARGAGRVYGPLRVQAGQRHAGDVQHADQRPGGVQGADQRGAGVRDADHRGAGMRHVTWRPAGMAANTQCSLMERDGEADGAAAPQPGRRPPPGAGCRPVESAETRADVEAFVGSSRPDTGFAAPVAAAQRAQPGDTPEPVLPGMRVGHQAIAGGNSSQSPGPASGEASAHRPEDASPEQAQAAPPIVPDTCFPNGTRATSAGSLASQLPAPSEEPPGSSVPDTPLPSQATLSRGPGRSPCARRLSLGGGAARAAAAAARIVGAARRRRSLGGSGGGGAASLSGLGAGPEDGGAAARCSGDVAAASAHAGCVAPAAANDQAISNVHAAGPLPGHAAAGIALPPELLHAGPSPASASCPSASATQSLREGLTGSAPAAFRARGAAAGAPLATASCAAEARTHWTEPGGALCLRFERPVRAVVPCVSSRRACSSRSENVHMACPA